MNDKEIKQTEQESLRRMLWLNTSLLIFLLFINVNIAIWSFINGWIYKAASFLVVSWITLFLWNKWRRMIVGVLN